MTAQSNTPLIPHLKPCPFCGRDAEYTQRRDGEGHAVICRNYMCAVFISGTPIHPAIPKWNTRAAESRLAADERMRDALQRCFDYYMGPDACGNFTCSCNNCGLCEMRDLTSAALFAPGMEVK